MSASLLPASDHPPPLYRQAWARFRTVWHLKAIGTMGFVALFFWAYLHVLRNPAFPVVVMPLTPIDHWIEFLPQALWFYLSLWLYTALPPALTASRRELIGYGWAILAVCTAGVGVFILYPTAVPVPQIDWDRYPDFAVLKGIDAAGNACPSLHVATSLFSAMWLDAQLRDMGGGWKWRSFNGLWCAAIVYSTMAVKQHVAIDVAGGLLLGGVCGALSLLWVPRWAVRSGTVARHDGER